MYLIFDALSMIREIRGKGLAIWLWGGLLNIPQLIGGLVFIYSLEGLVILLTEIFSLIVAGQIHKRWQFSRIIGICHLPWLAMLPWLIWRIVNFEHSVLLGFWLYYVAITVLISLVFDVVDVFRFFRGNRTFSWAD